MHGSVNKCICLHAYVGDARVEGAVNDLWDKGLTSDWCSTWQRCVMFMLMFMFMFMLMLMLSPCRVGLSLL